MTTDHDLIELIERLRPAAAISLQYEFVPQLERPGSVSSIWDVAEPLKAAMNSHPDFADLSGRFFLGKQISFSNQYQAMNLLRVAVRSGAAEALAWYRRVLTTTRAKMRVVAEVYGLWVQQPYTFSNGVTLLPVSELPNSPNSRFLKQPISVRHGIEFPVAVMFELDEVESEDSNVGHKQFLEISEKMRKTVTAFVLSDDAAPTMGASWQEFANSELEWAEFGRVWTASTHDGRRAPHPANVTDGMLHWVEKYLQLSSEVALACDNLDEAKRAFTSL